MPNFLNSDWLIISAGAVVGANARYLISRYAAKLLGPVFPYGTLYQRKRQPDRRFFRDLDDGKSFY